MYHKLKQRIAGLQSLHRKKLFKGAKIGLEKESLRVSEKGTISHTSHPKVLGSALTNPYITTDYSESLLELITPPLNSASAALGFLQDIQKFVYTQLQDEIMWCTSMPCVLAGADSIPIAQYGSSNAGIMKTVYRRGLGHRYGKMMQVIAGVHYNYSVPKDFWPEYQSLEKDSRDAQTFISESYFQMIRNLQRYGWLIPYLFGASPAVCRSFMDGIEKILEPFDEFTYHHPYATSLRLSDIGYQNYKEGKSGIKADYNSLASYVSSLKHAIETPSPDYKKFGIKIDGEYQQLNSNLLQIENEYYSTIRPKQLTGTYEKPTVALAQRGVEYVELRSLDVNVLEPLGVSESQLLFLEVFLIFCLLQDSPLIDSEERKEIDKNQSSTAHHGREPGLKLHRNGKSLLLSTWATELFTAMRDVSELLDSAHQGNPYLCALDHFYQSVQDPDLTPSAQILAEMKNNGEAFFPYSMRYALHHAKYFESITLDKVTQDLFQQTAIKSIEDQQRMEADNSLSFDEFLKRYFAETLEPSRSHMHI